MGPLMIKMAFMPLYMWEMWDVTPVTHERTDTRTVESRAVFSLNWIRKSPFFQGKNTIRDGGSNATNLLSLFTLLTLLSLFTLMLHWFYLTEGFLVPWGQIQGRIFLMFHILLCPQINNIRIDDEKFTCFTSSSKIIGRNATLWLFFQIYHCETIHASYKAPLKWIIST